MPATDKRMALLTDIFMSVNGFDNPQDPLMLAIIREFVIDALDGHPSGTAWSDAVHDIAAVRDVLMDDVHRFADALAERVCW